MPEPLKGKKLWVLKHELYDRMDDVEVFYAEDVKSAVEWLLKEIQKKINEVSKEKLKFSSRFWYKDFLEGMMKGLKFSKELIKKAFEDVVEEDERIRY